MPADDRSRLEARNAAMRDQVDKLLGQFNRQTAQLREAQEAAAQASATVTSKDGLVTAKIDASGSLAGLTFAPSAFERSTPETLARTVLDVVRTGSTQVRQQVAELMAPLSEGMPDLSDLVDGAPSLRGLMPDLPKQAEEPPPAVPITEDRDAQPVMRTGHQGPPTPPRPVRPAPAPEADEPRSSWLTDGRG